MQRPEICTPNWIRTSDRRFRKPLLYPAELWVPNYGCKYRKSLKFTEANFKEVILQPVLMNRLKYFTCLVLQNTYETEE